MVGLLRRQRVRRPSRARIQRYPQCRGADRRLAAVQIPGHGHRCRTLRRSAHHPGRRQDDGRPGLLHAVVRRARPRDRRRHGVAAGRDALSMDGGGSKPALVQAERRRPGRARRRHLRGARRAGPAGADIGAGPRRRLGRRDRAAEVFPRDQRNHRRRSRRHLAHGIHRRSRLRDLDACEARRASTRSKSGTH